MSVAQRANQAYETRSTRAREYTQPIPRTTGQTRPAARRNQPLALQRAVLFLCAILAAAACMGLLYMKSQVLETQREINKIQKDITSLQRANSEISAQVTAAQNIGDIMERAQKLGMKAPKQSQVFYVTLGDTVRADMSAKTVGQGNTAQ